MYYIQSDLSIPDRAKEIQESRSLTNIHDSFKKLIVVKDYIMPRRNEEWDSLSGYLISHLKKIVWVYDHFDRLCHLPMVIQGHIMTYK